MRNSAHHLKLYCCMHYTTLLLTLVSCLYDDDDTMTAATVAVKRSRRRGKGKKHQQQQHQQNYWVGEKERFVRVWHIQYWAMNCTTLSCLHICVCVCMNARVCVLWGVCVYVLNLLRIGELSIKNMEICGEFEYRIEFYPIQMGVNDIHTNLFIFDFFSPFLPWLFLFWWRRNKTNPFHSRHISDKSFIFLGS